MKVGLFIPCYINAIYPNVGVASYRLLTRVRDNILKSKEQKNIQPTKDAINAPCQNFPYIISLLL